MAEINLLKQNSRSESYTDILNSVVVKVLIVVILVLAGFYVWTFIQVRAANSQAATLQNSIVSANQAISAISGTDELVTRQGQLKELSGILAQHPYWSAFINELARVTLKNANYLSIKAAQDGTVSMVVAVPTLADLDKFLQVFDYPGFNQNFSDVRISSIGTQQIQDKVFYTFNVDMSYNTSLLQYSPQPTQ